MNYYKRHIGDYLKDTAHLSLLEHGIYTRLLDVYYTRESAIPEAQAARLIGARSEAEREAMQLVLEEFFELRDGVWIQHRCERELAEKESKAETNRVNGKRGGRPKKTTEQEPKQGANENPEETQPVSDENPAGLFSETQTEPTENLSHKPIANNHEPYKSSSSSNVSETPHERPPLPQPSEQTKRIGLVCRLLRSKGVNCNPAQFAGKHQGLENHSDDDFHLAVQTLIDRGEKSIGLSLVALVLGDITAARQQATARPAPLRKASVNKLPTTYTPSGRL